MHQSDLEYELKVLVSVAELCCDKDGNDGNRVYILEQKREL